MFEALSPTLRRQAAAAAYRRAVVSSLPTPTTPLHTLNFARAFTSRADIENQFLQMVIEAIEAHEREMETGSKEDLKMDSPATAEPVLDALLNDIIPEGVETQIMFKALRPAAFRSNTTAAVYRRAVVSPLSTPTTPLYTPNFARAFASGPGLVRPDIEKRVLEICVKYNLIKNNEIPLDINFTALHLDSLDAVEFVMNVEEEFSINIPDNDAARINTIAQAVDTQWIACVPWTSLAASFYMLNLVSPVTFFQLSHSPHQPRPEDIMFRALRPATFRCHTAAAVYRRAVVSPLPTPTTPLHTLNFARTFASSRSDIESLVLKAITQVNPKAKVTLQSRFKEDLKMDSLEAYELHYCLEQQLNVTFPEQEAADIETVDQLINCLCKLPSP
ncbi:MAG: hypothetical protein J3Q66DRAFT_434981 [Benniella sp.]|nr:MAG: hypothetical protein J3Q66DRAFT_434981 [Benniella sp.]